MENWIHDQNQYTRGNFKMVLYEQCTFPIIRSNITPIKYKIKQKHVEQTVINTDLMA